MFGSSSAPFETFWRIVLRKAWHYPLASWGTGALTLVLGLLVSGLSFAIQAYVDGWPATRAEMYEALKYVWLGPAVSLGLFAWFVYKAGNEVYAEQRNQISQLEGRIKQLESPQQNRDHEIVVELASFHSDGIEIKNRIVRKATSFDEALKPVIQRWDSSVRAYLQANLLHMVGRYELELYEAVDVFSGFQIGARAKQWAKFMDRRLSNLQGIIEKVAENRITP